MPDLNVRPNDYRPDADVIMPHNAWYATSWETTFGNQIDEAKTKQDTQTNEETRLRETTEDNAEISK